MDKKILNEINRNRKLMGIVEQNQKELIKKGKFADVNYEMYEDTTTFHMGPFSIDNEHDMKKVFLDRLMEMGIPESECSQLKLNNKTVSCEIDTDNVKKLMGLNKSNVSEQGVVDAVTSGVETGSKFSDDEYMLMGMINSFLSNPKSNIDPINKSWNQNAEWITKYREPVGRFGKILFDYLNNNGEKYDEDKFSRYLRLFNNPIIYNGNKPKDDEFIKLGKSITDFQYNN